jgi:hypothetical protein
LDLVMNEVLQAAPSAVAGVVARFDKLAKKNDDGFPTSFSWVSGSKKSNGNFTAVAVSYGPIGRVAFFEGGQRAKGGMSLSYMVQRSPRILAIDDDGLLVASSFVRDAGMRDNTRIDTAHINLGRARNSSFLAAGQTFDFEHTLDWGGASMKDGALIVDSIDSPKSFFVAESEALMRHHRVYSFGSGELTLRKDVQSDSDLRAVDDWIERAQKASKPNIDQSKVRKVLREPQMVLGIKRHGSSVVLECDSGTLVFTLAGSGQSIRVKGVSVRFSGEE